MDRKRDKQGRFVKMSNSYKDRIFNFRVTDHEYQLIREAKKKGFSPREVVIQEAQKVVQNET